MRLTQHATVLLVEDVARSVDYYADALGFETSRWELNPDHYGYASRDGCHFHFARFEGAQARPNPGTVSDAVRILRNACSRKLCGSSVTLSFSCLTPGG